MLKSVLMSLNIGLIVGVLTIKLIGVDNKKNYEKGIEDSVKMLQEHGCSEEEIKIIMEKAEKDLRTVINSLVFLLLFVLFLIAKFL